MSRSITMSIQGSVVEEELHFSLVELCRASGATEQELAALIDEGALQPSGRRHDEWRFNGASLRRARTAAHLARDLEINASGVALALDLLDQVASLEAQLAHAPRR